MADEVAAHIKKVYISGVYEHGGVTLSVGSYESDIAVIKITRRVYGPAGWEPSVFTLRDITSAEFRSLIKCGLAHYKDLGEEP